MKELLGAATAAVLVFAADAALAADLPTKAPAYAPPIIYNWTGFYIGAHVGAGWGDTTATDDRATNGSCWNRCGFQWTARPKGFVGGGQAGYNWQAGNIVFGVEGDVGFLGTRGSAAAIISTDTIVHTDGGFYATARGRLGLAFNTTLVYGTGGWIGADLGSTVNDNIGSSVNTNDGGFKSGWIAGGGMEFAAIGPWSIKVEVLHYDLGDKQVGGICCGGGVTQFFGIKETGNIARMGLNYRFGGPLVARY